MPLSEQNSSNNNSTPGDSFPSSTGNTHVKDKKSTCEMKKSSPVIGVSTESQGQDIDVPWKDMSPEEIKSLVDRNMPTPPRHAKSPSWLGSDRNGDSVAARQLFAWMLRKNDLTLERIGVEINRDYTTVMAAIDKAEYYLQNPHSTNPKNWLVVSLYSRILVELEWGWS